MLYRINAIVERAAVIADHNAGAHDTGERIRMLKTVPPPPLVA